MAAADSYWAGTSGSLGLPIFILIITGMPLLIMCLFVTIFYSVFQGVFNLYAGSIIGNEEKLIEYSTKPNYAILLSLVLLPIFPFGLLPLIVGIGLFCFPFVFFHKGYIKSSKMRVECMDVHGFDDYLEESRKDMPTTHGTFNIVCYHTVSSRRGNRRRTHRVTTFDGSRTLQCCKWKDATEDNIDKSKKWSFLKPKSNVIFEDSINIEMMKGELHEEYKDRDRVCVVTFVPPEYDLKIKQVVLTKNNSKLSPIAHMIVHGPSGNLCSRIICLLMCFNIFKSCALTSSRRMENLMITKVCERAILLKMGENLHEMRESSRISGSEGGGAELRDNNSPQQSDVVQGTNAMISDFVEGPVSNSNMNIPLESQPQFFTVQQQQQQPQNMFSVSQQQQMQPTVVTPNQNLMNNLQQAPNQQQFNVQQQQNTFIPVQQQQQHPFMGSNQPTAKQVEVNVPYFGNTTQGMRTNNNNNMQMQPNFMGHVSNVGVPMDEEQPTNVGMTLNSGVVQIDQGDEVVYKEQIQSSNLAYDTDTDSD